MARIFSAVKLVWEIPLSLLSFLFYRSVRLFLQLMVRLRYSRNKKPSPCWVVLCAETLERPLALPRIMTTGPRWNTHAIVAVVGPLDVRKTVSLDAKKARESARHWTVVIYTFPDATTVASVGSFEPRAQNQWTTLEVKRGRYMCFLRYYEWRDEIELPSIKVDGEELVGAQRVPPDINNFYLDLRRRKNAFYLCLAYYIPTLLRLRKWLSLSFVGREYLPVGNPETQFCYGPIKAGEFLSIQLDVQLLRACNVYFTLYDRASFPVLWYQIREETHATPRCEENGSYLLRINSKSPVQPVSLRDRIHVSVCRSG